MKTISLIKQTESKIQETKQLINNYRNELASHEKTLSQFIQQLSEIKLTMKLKNNKNNALDGVNNK